MEYKTIYYSTKIILIILLIVFSVSIVSSTTTVSDIQISTPYIEVENINVNKDLSVEDINVSGDVHMTNGSIWAGRNLFGSLDCSNITNATSNLCILVDTDTNRSNADILSIASVYNDTALITPHPTDTNRSNIEILSVASVYNDTSFILNQNYQNTTQVNDSIIAKITQAFMEALGFVIGSHTIDTTIGNCSSDNSCGLITYDSELSYTVLWDAIFNSTGDSRWIDGLWTNSSGDATFSGNVGIGTSNPSIKLDVNGSGIFRGDLNITGTLYGGSPVKIGGGMNITTGHVYISAGDLHIDGNLVHDQGDVSFSGGSFDVAGEITATKFIAPFLQSATGNLKLQANAVGDVILFSSADIDDADEGKELRVWRNAAEGNNYIRTYITSTENALIHSNTNMLLQSANGKNIQLNSGQHIYLNLGDESGSDEVKIRDSGANDVATIDSDGNAWFNGNVGIGISPSQPLSIMGNGASGEVGITQNQLGGLYTMELTTADLDGNQATRLLFRGNSNTSDIEFYTGGRGEEQVIMFLEGSNGFIGIGTITPGFRLDVVGAGQFSQELYVGADAEFASQVAIGKVSPTEALDVEGNISVTGIVDGRDIAADGIKLDNITNGAEIATKEFFLPPGAGILDNNAVYDDEAISLPDAVTFARAYFTFHLPSDFSSMTSGYPKIVMMPGTGGGGNVRIAFNSKSGGVGEQLGANIDNIAEYTKAVSATSSIIIEEDISAAFDGLSLSAGDSVSFYIQRDSDDGSDTLAGDLNVVGVIIKYEK